MPAPASERTLIVQTSFLGDVVLTTPLIERAARDGPVDVVVRPDAAPLLANNPWIRQLIVYDKRGRERGVAAFARLAARLRDARYTQALHAQASMRSSALTALGRIPTRVGFVGAAGASLYTHTVPSIDNDHHARRLLRLAGPEEAKTIRPALYPGDEERAAVDDLLARHDAMGAAVVALAPGSVWATKRWPHFEELARSIGDLGRVVVLGSSADRPLADAIVAATDGRAMDATGRLSLLASAELIRRSRLIVTNDSSPLHLASAMNTPTVAIFGPTVPEFGFGPLADRSFVAGLEALPCRPCDRHGPMKCPLGHWRCMRDLGPATIADAARALVATS